MHPESDDDLASLLPTGIALPSLHHLSVHITYQATQRHSAHNPPPIALHSGSPVQLGGSAFSESRRRKIIPG